MRIARNRSNEASQAEEQGSGGWPAHPTIRLVDASAGALRRLERPSAVMFGAGTCPPAQARDGHQAHA